MAFSLFSVVSLSIVYRLTINFHELPYTPELKNAESEEFVSTSRDIVNAVEELMGNMDGRHVAKVADFRYHKIIGSLVSIDIYCEKESPLISDVLLSAVKRGKLGKFAVSDEGFELHVVRDAESRCSATEFTCLDKTCIPADQRCDGRRDCPDGSDEHKDHGKCKRHQPIIHQTEKMVFVPKNGVVHLSAFIDQLSADEKLQIVWAKDGVLLSVGSIPLSTDPRIHIYQKHEKHYLSISNTTEKDNGTYKMIIQGMNVEADFEVRITSDLVPAESDECPIGERACRSGHCLSVSRFCDRRVQCPDGDDEEGCSENQCKSNEFRCESTNICVPTIVRCDGWRDCHDGSDEKNCNTTKIHKSHHVAKLNVLCQDGSEPKFSLHGSSYCWTNKVCPSFTECVHGLCCPISKTGKRSSADSARCPDGQFECKSGECIGNEKKCNRKYDCADGSDETTCDYYLAVQKYHETQQRHQQDPQPTASHHHHQEQQIVEHDQTSENEDIECSDQEFRCPYLSETKCFHYDKLCDGVDDCGDGSDETNCDSNELGAPSSAPQELTASSTESRCTAQQFECKRDGRCIEKHLECNRKYDCVDGSDETECEYFKSAMSRREEESPNAAQNEAEERRRAEERERQELERTHQEHARRVQQQEEEHRRHLQQQDLSRQHQQISFGANEPAEVTFADEYDGDTGVGCLEHEFQCAIGECIDKQRVCDTRPDCLDASDEQNCGDSRSVDTNSESIHHVLPSPQTPEYHHDQDIDSDDEGSDIQITIFPTEKEVRDGRDATFECRARTSDNSVYPSTRWARVGGPLPPSAHDSGGRLTLNPVSLTDAGTYICVATHNGHTVEARATLNVVSYGPQEVANGLRSSGTCMADEKACGNNECVKNEYVCDGEPDCRDRSDEANCPAISRTCEPNEFKCNNNKCVQKMWLCDGDDDCGDNSDEMNCNAKSNADGCKPTEFQCHDRRQCVPASFHCDGTNDCHDGSDEVGCVQPTVVDPPQTNLQVPRGSTFSLTCKAVAVPEPYINWRLNWGPVCEPPRCLQTSEGGYGTLTIHDAQPVDQGAYTCEAINVKGRVLATPDCIVRVVDEQRPTYPPPTAPPQRQACDTRGAVSPYPNSYGSCDCKPQVTGPNCDQCKPGAFHLSEKSPEGCLKCFCFGITNDCRSSGYYRTKDRLMFAGDAEGVTMSDVEERSVDRDTRYSFAKTGYLTFDGTTDGITKYWRLPQRFLGDKVTSYGGKMEFEIEFSGSGSLSSEPIVVLKGNQNILVHRVRNQDQVLRSDSPVRITVETYETNYEQMNGAPATREDLLMVLADLDAFLIRATHISQQSSTSLGDVSWEIAVDRQTSDGMALEVEQCACPPGYVGTSCEDCAPGYERSGHGPYLGTCVPVQRSQSCGPGAVTPTAQQGQCQCKNSVVGAQCDRCAPNSFGLSPTNPQGCIPCFCSGVTQQCSASNYRRTNVAVDYSRGDRDQLELTTSDSRQPFSPSTRPYVTGQQIEFRSFDEARGQTLYWKLPEKFLGNKVTAYGGSLKYTVRFNGNGNPDQSADVILRGNDITLQYKHRQPIHAGRENTIEVELFENNWQRVDGQQATREHLLMTLADLDTLLIKSTYTDDCADSSLLSVNFEYAEPYGTGLTAAEVEQCICPPGYVGTSCEDCAPGYSRTGGGLYLGLCEKCECNGHANQCDKEYGYCLDCQHNTEGDQCERCKPGFIGDARRGTPQDCQPAATRAPCHCNNHSPRGCDSFGRCLLCEHSTEGTHCERCKKGYYGDATKGTPYDCTPCPCPGASDCYLDSEGQVACRICPAGLQGRLCDECAPGYTRSNKPAGRICEPIGTVTNEDITFVQKPHEALRVRIMEPKRQLAHPGDRVHWICQVVGYTNEKVHLEWIKVGSLSLPANAKSYNGYLVLESVESQHAGQYRCQATTITQYATDDALLTVSRRTSGRPPQPVIDPPHLVVDEGEPAAFRCWVPGIPDCQITWHRDQLGGPLPHGVYQTGNALKIPQSQLHHAGRYICSAANQYGIGQSPPAVLEVNRPAVPPKVDPVQQTIDRGQPARFKCWVPGNPNVHLKWSRPGGGALPPGVQEQQGILHIPRVNDQETGQYICTATDPRDNIPRQSEPVSLNVRDPEPPQRRLAPQVDPPVQTVNVDDPAQFRCWVPGEPRAQLKWTRRDGRPLPQGTLERDGFLRIDHSQLSDAGEYECTATEPDGTTQKAPPARLNVNEPQAIQPQIDPPTQTVDEGSPSRIRCWVPGHPNINLQWIKRGRRPLPQHARVSQGTLDISRTLKSDEDEYTCIATDPNTNRHVESGPARINVRSPIRPIIDPPEQTVPEGSPIRLRCYVPGHPNLELNFRRKSEELSNDAVIRNGDLSIHQAELSDQGEYICSATDPSTDEPVDSSPANVYVQPKGPAPNLESHAGDETPVISPPSQTVNEGEPARIECHVPGNPRASQFLSFERVDARPLPFGSSDNGGLLSIPSTTRSDAGDYICIYSPHNRPENTKKTSPSVLNVTPPTGTPPRPVATPPLLSVSPRTPARFHCEPNSDTPARVHWTHTRDQQDLPEGVVQDGDDLIIHSASENNIGEYVCTATNDFGTGDADPVKLEITDDEEPPTAQVEPRTWNGKPGDRHQFTCIVTGSPTPKITWTGPDGSPLPHDVTALEPNILDFSNGRSELNGDYTCTATNPVGEASDHGSVNIGPSLTVKTNPAGPKLMVTVGEPLNVKCEAFGAPGDPEPEVEWLHDPGPERGDLPDDFKPVTISEQFIKHPSVGLGNAGVYTCKGSTAHATATKNIYIEVVEPSKIATVSILGGSSQSFDQGEQGELICTATGSSLVDRLEWEKVDDQLPTDVEEHNEPGLLHFPSFKKSYAGEYRCNGYRNNEKIASATVNVHFTADDDDEPKVDIEPPRVRIVSQGDSIVLKCSVQGDNKTRVLWWHTTDDLTKFTNVANTNILHLKYVDDCDRGFYYCTEEQFNYEIGKSPNILIVEPRGQIGAENGEHFKWALLRGGSLVRQLGTEPTLEIKNANPSNDFGVYRCNVEDNNGLVIGSAYTAVSVGQQDKTNAQIVKFDDKSDASFTCPVYSVPGSKIEWSYENGELPAKAVPNGNKIDIKEFDDTTSGVYICRVSFDNNVVEGFVNAQIFVPDTIIQVLLEVSSESPQIGDRAWFDCKVTGDPSAVISWTKEGTDELPANAQVTGGRLLFTDLKEDNAGVYRCIAKTKAGPLQTRTVLNVGSGKRKRKHLGHRRGRRLMRHRRRGFQSGQRRVRTTKLFGSWF